MQCRLHLLVPSTGSRLKVLDDYMSVDVWWVLRKGFSFATFVVQSYFGSARFVLWRRVVQLVSMSQSDRRA